MYGPFPNEWTSDSVSHASIELNKLNFASRSRKARIRRQEQLVHENLIGGQPIVLTSSYFKIMVDVHTYGTIKIAFFAKMLV